MSSKRVNSPEIGGFILFGLMSCACIRGYDELKSRYTSSRTQAFFMNRGDYRWYYPKWYLRQKYRFVEKKNRLSKTIPSVDYDRLRYPGECMVLYTKPYGTFLYERQGVFETVE